MDKRRNNRVPVTFSNKNGEILFGIIHEPVDTKNKDTGVIILSPGVKGRVAPYRLYLKMARLFESIGFLTLRFDFSGLGDSEGTINETYLADFYQSVELGRYAEETIMAMDWMETHYGVRQFILAGLCGGAITGLHAGARDRRVISLIGIGLPVILSGLSADRSLFLTKAELSHTQRKYIKKLFNPRSWTRLLSFKSDYKLMVRSLLKPIFSSCARQTGTATQQTVPDGKQSQQHNQTIRDNFNPRVPGLFKDFLGRATALLIFGEADKNLWEFREKYMDRYNTPEQHHENLEVRIISQANHILSFSEWGQDFLETVGKWLQKFAPNR